MSFSAWLPFLALFHPSVRLGFSKFSLLNELYPPKIFWQWPWREFKAFFVCLFVCGSDFIVLLLTRSFFLKLQTCVLNMYFVGWLFSFSRFPSEVGVLLSIIIMVTVKAIVGSTRQSLSLPLMILGWSEFLFNIFSLVSS